MKRIILFSTPIERIIEQLVPMIFSKSIKNKVFAYMPSNGADCPEQYVNEWKTYSEQNNFEFIYLDNSKINSHDEKKSC